VALAAGAACLLGLALAAAGFSWLAGLSAAKIQYLRGASRFRPQGYFLIGDLGAFALVLGPAAAVALARVRSAGTWMIVAGALIAVAVADATGLSKGEVERIWLPFAPWVLAATAAFDDAPAPWLTLQAGAALALQAGVRSPW
jgi:hypothetical protein